MTYMPNIPIANQSPESQTTQLQTNFSQFQNIFSSLSGSNILNHTAINLYKQGQHQTIIMETQPPATDPAIVSNEVVLYNRTAAQKGGSKQQIFAKIPKYLPTNVDHNIIGSIPMQLTFNKVNTAGPQYQSFIAGGYLVYFGTASGPTPTITLVPQPTKILSVVPYSTNTEVISSITTPYQVSVINVNNTDGTFQLNATAGATMTWVAICQQ